MKLIKVPDDKEIREPLSGHQLGDPVELESFEYTDLAQNGDGSYSTVKELQTAKPDRPIYWYPAGRVVAYKTRFVREPSGAPPAYQVWVVPIDRVLGMWIKPLTKTDVERPATP